MSELVVLVGNPRPGSRTRTLAQAVAASLLRTGTLPSGQTTVDLAEAAAVTFGPLVRPPVPVDDPHRLVREARLLVVATPTYKGTYTGLLKVFLDQYGHRELAGVVAVPVAIAAAPPHRDSVTAALLALLGELGAATPAGALAVLESELDDPARVADEWVAAHSAALARALG